MLRFAIDQAPGATLTTETTGGASLSSLADRNPANTTAVAAELKVLITLPNTTTPVSCVSLFGISSGLYGGSVNIKQMASAPAGGDWASYTYTADIERDRNLWIPFNSVGYDSTYYKYIMVSVTPPSGGSGYLGEVACGLLQAPIFNYTWGRSQSMTPLQVKHQTLGGITYAYGHQRWLKADHVLNWDNYLTDQAIYQMRRWYTETENGLYPCIFIPDDTVRTGQGVFYSRLDTPLTDVEAYFSQYSASIRLSEAMCFEDLAATVGA